MNKRINEEFAHKVALTLQSVAASTAKTGAWLDMSGVMEAEFVATSAALGKDKSLTVELLASTKSDGTDPEKIGEVKITDTVGTEVPVAVLNYRPTAYHGRYVAIRVAHDAAAAAVCGATAILRCRDLPAGNANVLNV